MRHFLLWLVIVAIGAAIPVAARTAGAPAGVSFGFGLIAIIVAGAYFYGRVL